VYGNIVSEIMAWELWVGDEVHGRKLGPVHNSQAGIGIFVDNNRHALGVEEYSWDLTAGAVALLDGLG